jgi:transglutaminase-like putative cysteine protease
LIFFLNDGVATPSLRKKFKNKNMLLRIEHELNYTYSQSVLLTPHYIYLTPKLSPNQEFRHFSLSTTPATSNLVKNVDAESNIQHVAYFKDSCQNLQIKTSFEIESQPFNPFSFIFFPFEAERLPFEYPEKEKKLLQLYLNQEGVTTIIHQFARQIAAQVEWKTLAFLTKMSEYIRANFIYEKRLLGEANSPEKTLISQKGTCRDYVVLMIEACKALGIAARFVSGYAYGSPEQAHELHAWVEVYLPGGGWRSFDPTEGKVADNQYVTLAASAQPALISPVIGTFRGAAKSSLEAFVKISKLA